MTTAAERAVKAAEEALAAAEAQLVGLDGEAERERREAAELEAEIAGKHERGEPVSADDRRRRREALADVEDVGRERETVVALIERRKTELREAHVNLAAVRAAEYEADARIRGDEIWNLLAELVEQWEQLEAINAAHHRDATTVRRAGLGGRGTALQKAGLENRKAVIGDLVRAIRPDLAARASA